MKSSSSRVLSIVARALLLAAALAQSDPQAAVQSFDSAEITKRVVPAVMLIGGTTGTGEILGTGFIISSDGKIATNLHVVETLKNGGVQLALPKNELLP
jgi:serine protease Do